MIRRAFPFLVVACFAQMIFCGCSERPKTPAEYAESRVRQMINGLSCASEQSVRKSAEIVTNLATIADNERCMALVEEWKSSLVQIRWSPWDGLEWPLPFETVVNVRRNCIAQALDELGRRPEESWNERLEAFRWAKEQMTMCEDFAHEKICNEEELADRWKAYENVALWYERLAVDYERDAVWRLDSKMSAESKDAVLRRIEQLLARRVRDKREVKLDDAAYKALGKKIASERDSCIADLRKRNAAVGAKLDLHRLFVELPIGTVIGSSREERMNRTTRDFGLQGDYFGFEQVHLVLAQTNGFPISVCASNFKICSRAVLMQLARLLRQDVASKCGIELADFEFAKTDWPFYPNRNTGAWSGGVPDLFCCTKEAWPLAKHVFARSRTDWGNVCIYISAASLDYDTYELVLCIRDTSCAPLSHVGYGYLDCRRAKRKPYDLRPVPVSRFSPSLEPSALMRKVADLERKLNEAKCSKKRGKAPINVRAVLESVRQESSQATCDQVFSVAELLCSYDDEHQAFLLAGDLLTIAYQRLDCDCVPTVSDWRERVAVFSAIMRCLECMNVKGYYAELIAKRRNAVMATLSKSCMDAGLWEHAEIVDKYR